MMNKKATLSCYGPISQESGEGGACFSDLLRTLWELINPSQTAIEEAKLTLPGCA